MKLLRTQAQPGGVSVTGATNGCILSGNNRGGHRLDFEYYVETASKAFFANKNILCIKALSLVTHLYHF